MSTKIEWASETWNYITGCDPISPGCDHCYAKKMANRLAGRYGYHEKLPFRITVHPDKLWKPRHIKRPSLIFCNSMGDIFHKHVEPEHFYEMLHVIETVETRHIYLFLTKRPANMMLMLLLHKKKYPEKPLPSNIMWGITAENEDVLRHRIPALAKCKEMYPEIKTFISFEPLLEKINLNIIHHPITIDKRLILFKPDWIIVGGETGPGARRMPREAVDEIYHYCKDNAIPFFFKKWGSAYKGILTEKMMRVCHSKIREEMPDWFSGT